MEIRWYVLWMLGHQLAKVVFSAGVVTRLDAFHGQAITREGVVWMRVKESLEHFAAGFGLWHMTGAYYSGLPEQRNP